MVVRKKRSYISLRLVLIVWFIVFSVVPLALVTGYSIVKFHKAIKNEHIQRLKSNGREIEIMLSDFYNQLINNRDTLAENPHVIYNITINDEQALSDVLREWFDDGKISYLSVYGRDGSRLTHFEKEYYSSLLLTSGSTNENRRLEAKYISHLYNKQNFGYVKVVGDALELILVSKISNSTKKIVGYIEQRLLLRQDFLNRIKNELKLEMLFVDSQNQPVNSTLPDFQKISSASLNSLKKSDNESLVDLQHNNNNYAFMAYSTLWDQSVFKIIIGTDKKDSEKILREVNVAFFVTIGLGVVFLIITILISTYLLLKPVRELINGLRAFEQTEALVQLKVKNRTEIGLLIYTFNQMSMKVFQTRNDLKKKIKELEKANSNLKEAQIQLVQSAKMTSLGQLVAGVAHELNNPIGFIYSNTSHLRDYTETLFKIIENIEKNPSNSADIKQQYDFDYIKKDLPLLIKSCQDGAQRTRDIVLGLRNFSRLEESQLKEIDLNESIDMTLELLKGETKNRIKLHRQYETIPKVHCYASQINQVIMNILTNAVHAIQGNGEIWISTTTIKASSNEVGKVQISIQDSGMGMSPEVVEKIFEPFFTTKEVGQGTGLGLSISYGIVQNHGGDIKVKSELNVGTEFIITIPIIQSKKNQ